MTTEKDICEIIKNNETLVHLLLSALLTNNKTSLKTQHKTFTVKQIGECYLVEEIKSYKLDKNFFQENQEELKEIYKKYKK